MASPSSNIAVCSKIEASAAAFIEFLPDRATRWFAMMFLRA